VDDETIRALVDRLGRRHPSGGRVVERAAILAEGADFTAVTEWITAHGGHAETLAATAPRHGLYGARLDHSGEAASTTPLRFVVPREALERPAPAAEPEDEPGDPGPAQRRRPV
jgi:hypothetical protein